MDRQHREISATRALGLEQIHRTGGNWRPAIGVEPEITLCNTFSGTSKVFVAKHQNTFDPRVNLDNVTRMHRMDRGLHRAHGSPNIGTEPAKVR